MPNKSANILGPVIKELRKQKKMTQADLSRITGIAQNTISNHENQNRALDENSIIKYAKALGVTPQSLYDSAIVKKSIDTKSMVVDVRQTAIDEINDVVKELVTPRVQKIAAYAEKQLNEQQNENVVPFPEQREIVTGRGTAAGAPIDGATQDAEVRRTRVNVDDIPASADEIVTVEGDSMEPDYPKYSQIFVRWQDTIDDGDLAVVRVADEGVTFKQVSRDYQQKKIVLHSLNDKYPDRYLDPEDISIIGVVIN